MPEKGVGRAGNGSNKIARRKRRKSKKGWAPDRAGKVGTVKGTAEREAGRAERRKEGSTRVVAEVEASMTETGAYRLLEVRGEIQEGTPTPSEPNQEAHLGGGVSGVCTAVASDS